MLESLGEIIFLGHNEKTLFFNSGNEKLNSTQLNFKESAIKVLIKMHIYSEWAFAKSSGKQTESEIRKDRFELFLKTIVPHLVEGMLKLTRDKDFRRIIENIRVKNLMMRVCMFFFRAVKMTSLVGIIDKHSHELLFDICFSLVRTFD